MLQSSIFSIRLDNQSGSGKGKSMSDATPALNETAPGSFIIGWAAKLFGAIQAITFFQILCNAINCWRSEPIYEDVTVFNRFVEVYVLCALALSVLVFWATATWDWSSSAVIWIALWRIIEVALYQIRIVVVGSQRPGGRRSIASYQRRTSHASISQSR